jgi:hypothetical protein
MSRIANLKAGAAIIHEWLGKGGVPVSQDHAERRALPCTGCPYNVNGGGVDKVLRRAADVVRQMIEAKNAMKLATRFDDKLHTCSLCGCALQLKVWVPGGHLAVHTTLDDIAKLPNWCEFKKELT